MTELYIKVRGKFYVARKKYPSRDSFDTCRYCDLKRVCDGKSLVNSNIVNNACAAWGYGWKRVKGSPVPEQKKNFWETVEPRHPRVVIEGEDPLHGPFRIPCDAGIAPLIIALNMAGVRTCYSCQGDPDGTGAYLAIVPEDETKQAVKMILDHWKGRFIYRWKDTCTCYYAYKERPSRTRTGHFGDLYRSEELISQEWCENHFKEEKAK